MRNTFILTTAAIALVAGLGSATAGERFATIEGLPIQALSADELAGVRGAVISLWLGMHDGKEMPFPGSSAAHLDLGRLPDIFHLHGESS
ncbi:MAG: hypothetical protein ACU0B1_05185 [Thermohalobaculum sp.]